MYGVKADPVGDAAQMIAEFAVDSLPDVVVTEESIADAEDATGRVLGRQQIERQDVHLERAGDRLRDHRCVAAEQAVGVKRDIEAAAALFFDLFHRFAGADRHRMAIGQGAATFEIEFRRIGGPAQDRGRCDTGPGAGKQRSARKRHRLPLLGITPSRLCGRVRFGKLPVFAKPVKQRRSADAGAC